MIVRHNQTLGWFAPGISSAHPTSCCVEYRLPTVTLRVIQGLNNPLLRIASEPIHLDALRPITQPVRRTRSTTSICGTVSAARPTNSS